MTPTELRRYLDLAASHGADYAEREMREDAAAYDEMARFDDMAAEIFERDAYGEDRNAPTGDDRYDSRGVEYRPRVNDAGEPWWM